jgi:hypothetical protein
MTKFIKNKLVALVLGVMVMTLGVVAPSFTNTAQAAAATTRTVYVDVEKNVIGQAPIVQPEKVTLDSSKTIIDATKQAIKQYTGDENNVNVVSTSYGNYVTGFADTTHNFDNYAYDLGLRDASSIIFDEDVTNQPIVTDANWLKEKEYNGISGWIFTVNNTETYGDSANPSYYTGDTTLADVSDGATIRWEFSAAMGADLGLNDAYLPTQLTSDGYYDWFNNTVLFASQFTRANKSTLISKMANHADKTDTAYTNALTVLQTLEATQTQVNTAAAAL